MTLDLSFRKLLRLADVNRYALTDLVTRFGLALRLVAASEIVPGSYWGESEAGLLGDALYARPDTPLHSVLHETSHYVCMTPERRVGLTRDAGGDDAEESAACYLQLLLADHLPRVGRERLMADMDAWGYSFRLGSTRDWFARDANDSRLWLVKQGLLDTDGLITWQRRE